MEHEIRTALDSLAEPSLSENAVIADVTAGVVKRRARRRAAAVVGVAAATVSIAVIASIWSGRSDLAPVAAGPPISVVEATTAEAEPSAVDEAALGEAAAALEVLAGDRFAGSWSTPGGNTLHLALTLGDHVAAVDAFASGAAFPVVIEYREGLSAPKLEEFQRRSVQRLRAEFPGLVGTWTDVQTGELVLQVEGETAEPQHRTIRDDELGTDVPLRIEFVHEIVGDGQSEAPTPTR